jgi:hypothetical protein
MPHTHPSDLQAHADCAASRTFAYLRAAGLIPPAERVTSQHIDDASGWHVVVVLTRWDGPPRLQLTGELPGGVPSQAPLRNVEKAQAPLRDVEQAAWDAAPGPVDPPVTIKQLARRANYRNTGHFQEAVRLLVDRGLLVRVRGGLRKSS